MAQILTFTTTPTNGSRRKKAILVISLVEDVLHPTEKITLTRSV